MALKNPSSFLYGIEITTFNNAIDFQIVSMGPVLQATLNLGFYSLEDLMNEVFRAISAADPSNLYTVSADRSYAGGTQNRTTIDTTGSYLSILWNSGPRAATTACFILGFAKVDSTGATSYTGTSSTGTILLPTLVGYNYSAPTRYKKNYGVCNVSTSGLKESLTWAIQQFIGVQFMYEPESYVDSAWQPFMDWAMQQRAFEFTPDITAPNTFYSVTLEQTTADGKGLAYEFKEMLPDFPFLYDTGMLKMRIEPQ